jgi:uncharacterized protein
MTNPLERATVKAIALHGSAAEREHLAQLAQRRLTSTRCDGCEKIAWPPRGFCPFCGGERVTVVPIGEGATLYAFTQQHKALRFVAPEVIGIVEIPGVGRILSAIDAPIESLAIGTPLEVDFVEIQPGITAHRFRPAAR